MGLEDYIRITEKSILPRSDEIEKGKALMDCIFRVLQQKSSFKIDRSELDGSTAKKTAITGHVDFDCVILINQNPQHSIELKNVAEDFHNILLLNTELQENDIKLSGDNLLQFELDHMEFDLCLAFNEAKNHNNGMKAHKQQANVYYQQFKKGAYSPTQMYPGLSKTSVDFVKNQSSFAHEVARLAKYWNKTLFLDLKIHDNHYVSGRSSFMELIAIHAANEEERFSSSASHLNAFRRFLREVRDIKTMKVRFPNTKCNINPLPTRYIIDPANPWKNFLEGITQEILEAFSSFAGETLERLKQVESKEISYLIPMYKKIFEIQPTWEDSQIHLAKPYNWIVGTVSCYSRYVDLKFNGDYTLISAKEVEMMKRYLSILVQRVDILVSITPSTDKPPADTTKLIKEEVQKSISEEINGDRVEWTPSKESYESRMTTITIPITNGSNQAVRISCDWKKR